jgi:ligand-binding sensor protein
MISHSDAGRWPYPAVTILKDEEHLLSLLLSGFQEEYHVPFFIIPEPIKDCRDILPRGGKAYLPDFCVEIQAKKPGLERCRNLTNLISEAKKQGTLALLFDRPCHLGLRYYFSPINISQYTVGYLVTGRCCSDSDLNDIHNKIHSFSKGFQNDYELNLLLASLPSVAKDQHAIEKMKADLIVNAQFLSNFLTNNYSTHKTHIVRTKHHNIEEELSSIYRKADNDIEKDVEKKLLEYCDFYGTRYICIFLASKPKDTLLDLIVQAGISSLTNGDLHFNCKKTRIAITDFSINKWDYHANADAMKRGVRGNKSNLLSDLSFIFPFELAGYTGMVVLGPFMKDTKVQMDTHLMNHFCHTIGTKVSGMKVHKILADKEKENERTIALSAHMSSSYMNNVLAIFDDISYNLEHSCLDLVELGQTVNQVKSVIETFSTRITAALDNPSDVKAIIPDLGEDHLHFDSISLGGLVDRCVNFNILRASKQNVDILVDDTVENLPSIWADAGVLSLAFNNLIENAIKYSYKDKRIIIKTGSINAIDKIEIQVANVGLEIKQDELSKIFDVGYRSAAAEKEKIAGHGLGLSQVKRIIELHCGSIGVTSKRIAQGAWGFHNTFHIVLPTLVFGLKRRE